MCTLSFVPGKNSYLIGMNRDERLTRAAAYAPRITGAGTVQAVYPREDGGGTWIGANETGISFALLNRNSTSEATAKVRSRGEVIPPLLESRSRQSAEHRIKTMDLRDVSPFRLIAFFPGERLMCQWNWDAEQLESFHLPWHARHWFSSGISDELAREVRGLSCTEAWKQHDAGSLPWLRNLHASHAPEQGSFSICMHRQDAATVSYTEIVCDSRQLIMRYRDGHLCEMTDRFDCELSLSVHPPALAAAS
jgi:hypothetical protein